MVGIGMGMVGIDMALALAIMLVMLVLLQHFEYRVLGLEVVTETTSLSSALRQEKESQKSIPVHFFLGLLTLGQSPRRVPLSFSHPVTCVCSGLHVCALTLPWSRLLSMEGLGLFPMRSTMRPRRGLLALQTSATTC